MTTITYTRDTTKDKKINKIIVPLHCWCPTSNGSTITSNIPADCMYSKEDHPSTTSKLYTYRGAEQEYKAVAGYEYTNCIDVLDLN